MATEAVLWGSAALDEDEFVRQFEACEYPNAMFRHADHVRLAWIYVRRFGPAAAEARIAGSIRRFAGHLNHPEKYHDTMTRAWLRLVASAHAANPDVDDFHRFAGSHAWLFDQRALGTFYSLEALASSAARSGWVAPDLRALPSLDR